MNIINLFWISLTIGFATPQNNSSLSGKWILKCYKDIILKKEECTSKTDSEIPITIEFRDNGKGILENEKNKIFTPNFTTKSSGTGLGLAMVKNIIESAGGSIHFTSDTSKGTSFFVNIPIIKN